MLVSCERGRLGPPTLEPLELSFGSEWVRDRKGRVVLLRGATYTVTETSTDFGGFRGTGELALFEMEELGMNLVRLPVSWAAFEPEAGRLAVQYLKRRVDPVVRLAAAHGMAVVLTMRGSPRGPCDGSDPTVPAWTCAQFRSGVDSACAFWRAEGPRGTSLPAHYAKAWTTIAAHYAKDLRVVAFDLFDEPTAGECFHPVGFEAVHLLPFYDRLARGIREVGATQTLFLEPPAGTLQLRPSAERIAFSLAFAPHIWPERLGPPADAAMGIAYDTAATEARRLGGPLVVGAYGADLPPEPGSRVRGTSPGFALQSLEELDRHAAGGAFYALHPKSEEDARFRLDRSLRAILMRPYARRIAGIPTYMSFDPRALEYTLRFEDDPTHSPPDPTEIYLPREFYGAAPDVEVSGDGSHRLDPKTQRLLVYRGSGATHEIRVRPSSNVD